MNTRNTLLAAAVLSCCAICIPLRAAALSLDEAETLARAAYKGDQSAMNQLAQAAQATDPAAETGMGEFYEFSQDYAQAVPWYQSAAQAGYAPGEYRLGACYFNGYGLPQDFGQAAQWYAKAAQQGFTQAQNDLGYCYEYGAGVQLSYADAVYWFQKSADTGDSTGEYDLGVMYYNGWGEQKSYLWAAYWEQKAAAQGNSMAESGLRSAMQFDPMLIVVNQSNQPIVGVYLCPADGSECNPSYNLLTIDGTGGDTAIHPGVQDTITAHLTPADYSSDDGHYFLAIETSDGTSNSLQYFKDDVLSAYQQSTFTYR